MAHLLLPPPTEFGADNKPPRFLAQFSGSAPWFRKHPSSSCSWICYRSGAFRLRGSSRISSSGRTPANSSSSSEEMLQQLHSRMERAIEEEDYKSAAFTRDTINTLLELDPMLKLKTLINKAVEEERYEDAAKYQDELEGTIQKCNPGPRCYSDTTTQGIRVQVRSVYINERSEPCKGQYFFAYRIRISNLSTKPVQVISRHWRITDGNGRTEHVRGVGIVGQQPVLLPGTNFEYTSACPLGTASGKMEGEYDVKIIDETSMLTFSVKIGSFDLAMPNDVVK